MYLETSIWLYKEMQRMKINYNRICKSLYDPMMHFTRQTLWAH